MKLRIHPPEGKGFETRLPEGDLTIGRHSDCDLQLPGVGVSRHHAQVRRRGEGVWVVDLDSHNGTFLDGQRLQPHLPHRWEPGQRMEIGEHSLALAEGEVVAESRPPRLTSVEFVLPAEDITTFDRARQRELIASLAEVAGVAAHTMSIANITAGSVRVMVDMPTAAAQAIKTHAQQGHPGLHAAGIERLRLAGEGEFTPVAPLAEGTQEAQVAPPVPAAVPVTPFALRSWKWLIFGGGLAALALIILSIIFLPRVFGGEPTPTPTGTVTMAPPTASFTPELPTETLTPTFTSTYTPTVTLTQAITGTP